MSHEIEVVGYLFGYFEGVGGVALGCAQGCTGKVVSRLGQTGLDRTPRFEGEVVGGVFVIGRGVG